MTTAVALLFVKLILVTMTSGIAQLIVKIRDSAHHLTPGPFIAAAAPYALVTAFFSLPGDIGLMRLAPLMALTVKTFGPAVILAVALILRAWRRQGHSWAILAKAGTMIAAIALAACACFVADVNATLDQAPEYTYVWQVDDKRELKGRSTSYELVFNDAAQLPKSMFTCCTYIVSKDLFRAVNRYEWVDVTVRPGLFGFAYITKFTPAASRVLNERRLQTPNQGHSSFGGAKS